MKTQIRLPIFLGMLLAAYAGLLPVSAASQANAGQIQSASAINWLTYDLRFNGIGVGVETEQKTLFVSLGTGFSKPANFSAKVSYKLAANGYRFAINGIRVANGGVVNLKALQYGAKIPIQLYRNGVLLDSYNLLFTNLPVIQLTAARIVDEPKSPGTFRLLSGKYRQDTGLRKMGIEFRGSPDSQTYEKKSLDVEIAKATNWQKGQDVKLLDLNLDSDWILDCVYVDTSFFRNLVSQDIFRAIRPAAYLDKNGKAHGQSSLRGHLAEVIKNGIYDGVYSLNEKPGRKMYGLQKITVPVDASGKELWGKVDFNKPENGSVIYKGNIYDDVFFDSTSVSKNFVQVYPKPKDAQRWYPLINFAHFVATASDKDFIAGIGKRIDLDSVADWWSLVLSSHAEDNIRHNFMLAKSGAGKFYMLSWDHDGSFGVQWFAFDPAGNNLIKRLTALPATGFNKKLNARWKQLRATQLGQKKMVLRFKTYIDESSLGGARARNIARWPISGDDKLKSTANYINSYLADWLPQADKMVQSLPEK